MMSRKGVGSRIQSGKSWSGTLEGDRGNKSMDVDTVRLLKTQDLGYIRTMRQVAMKEVAKLREQVVLDRGFDHLDDEEEEDEDNSDDDDDDFNFATPLKPKPARKIVFMDDDEARQEVIQDLEDQEDDDDEDEEEFKGFDEGDEKKGPAFERAKNLRRTKRQLEQARRKLKGLTDAETELEIQRAKMAKTATSGGQTKKGKKIMVRTRKR